jgi:hypothetical protein
VGYRNNGRGATGTNPNWLNAQAVGRGGGTGATGDVGGTDETAESDTTTRIARLDVTGLPQGPINIDDMLTSDTEAVGIRATGPIGQQINATLYENGVAVSQISMTREPNEPGVSMFDHPLNPDENSYGIEVEYVGGPSDQPIWLVFEDALSSDDGSGGTGGSDGTGGTGGSYYYYYYYNNEGTDGSGTGEGGNTIINNYYYGSPETPVDPGTETPESGGVSGGYSSGGGINPGYLMTFISSPVQTGFTNILGSGLNINPSMQDSLRSIDHGLYLMMQQASASLMPGFGNSGTLGFNALM